MVNYMYQTSLVQFLEHFDLSIDCSEKNNSTPRYVMRWQINFQFSYNRSLSRVTPRIATNIGKR